MPNHLIQPSRAVAELLAAIEKQGPATQRLTVYMLQTGLGGFPAGKYEFDLLADAAAKELENQPPETAGMDPEADERHDLSAGEQ